MTESSMRRALLVQVAKKAGYQVGHVTPLENGRIAAELHHDGDQDTANLVAAWYGMLAQEPRTLAFHEHPEGTDVLHTWTTRARPQNVKQAAKDLGIKHIHVSPTGRVYSWDQGRQRSGPIFTLVRNSRGEGHTAFKGTGNLVGGTGGPDAPARVGYRQAIERYSK